MSQSSMINNIIFSEIDKETATVLSCHYHLTPKIFDPLCLDPLCLISLTL